nr:hypothetical protein [Tanacetum cinerariifolium]
ELVKYINALSWNRPIVYYDDDDDDEDYTIAITPVLPTEELDNSLSMGDEHLSTIPEMKSDEVIKSSVEDLIHSQDIDYVEASPPELVSLKEVKDEILHEKLLNIHLLIAKIESLNDKPTPDRVIKSPSLFPIPIKNSDSFFENTTTQADNSLPKYDLFLFEIEPDQGELTSIVMDDILGEPLVHVPNVLPTHPNLMMDSDFISSDDSLGSDLEVSFPFRTRNNIFDPRISYQ